MRISDWSSDVCSSDLQKYDGSSLRDVVHGAAPCAPPVKQAMLDWWGPVINEYYGSTETGIAVWLSAADARTHPGSVGRVLPGCTEIGRPSCRERVCQ